jgi:hypothetical protein
MDNQQLLNLTREQLQVLLTGKFGDGCLTTPKNEFSNSKYSTNCIYKEYLEFKQQLLDNIAFNISFNPTNGYSNKPIYCLTTRQLPEITYLKNLDLENSIKLLDDLGIALWIYDDGSLHKTKLFYNINCQNVSQEIQEDVFIPHLRKFGIFAKTTRETKQDGRIFYYLRVSKYEGAYEISKFLEKYYVNCYSYKIWSSTTIQKWSKLQEELKSTPRIISNKMKGVLLDKIILEDIV